jgi:hypothetical protein
VARTPDADRQEQEAEISGDMLAIERAECNLIWTAEAQGEVIDFRADTAPQALLGVGLVNQPRGNGSAGSSAELAWDILTTGGR